jgi:hypothetical protein
MRVDSCAAAARRAWRGAVHTYGPGVHKWPCEGRVSSDGERPGGNQEPEPSGGPKNSAYLGHHLIASDRYFEPEFERSCLQVVAGSRNQLNQGLPGGTPGPLMFSCNEDAMSRRPTGRNGGGQP